MLLGKGDGARGEGGGREAIYRFGTAASIGRDEPLASLGTVSKVLWRAGATGAWESGQRKGKRSRRGRWRPVS